MKTAIILISEAGLSIAQSLLNELPDSEIFTLRHEEGCTHIESAGKFTAENFNRYDAFVFIGAHGNLCPHHRSLREEQIYRPCRGLRGQYR